ncbi:sodium channel protein 1 brain isoform X2 [Nematostella vectensis]|uniref:sodium channel protein 1 brain isoform X2 n=1 Tax=Nematostella vectensis TaxID=45351 RepID=UPI002076F70A|nr:sodium channel protein 1 brain isoform X2 [Nematostella vectensis]
MIRNPKCIFTEKVTHALNNDQSFLVIAGKFGKTQVYRFNRSKSLYLFGPENPIRQFSLKLITNQYFEMFVLLTILVNCVFLAMTNPPEQPEYVFAAIYTIEMFCKIIAKGFALHRYAYLRDKWNWLDFIVVILGYVTISPDVANLSGIRTFRVFRALRTISAVKGLKAMVNTLLVSMKMLWDVMVLTLFFICIFALIGMQLFIGELRNKCALPVPENLSVPYRTYASNSSIWYLEDNEPILCGNTTGSRTCPTNYTCLPHAGGNPNFGYTSFDHFGWALLTGFQLITLDFWENVYNNVIYTMGPWYVVYFAVVIFFGPFFLVNLVLAVVAASYENEVKASKMETEEERKEQKRVASSYSVRRASILSIVYGQGDVIPDEPNSKGLYDIPVVTCSEVTKSDEEALSVFQIRQESGIQNQNLTLHQNWIGSRQPSSVTLPSLKPEHALHMNGSQRSNLNHTSDIIGSQKSNLNNASQIISSHKSSLNLSVKKEEKKRSSIMARRWKRFRRRLLKFTNGKVMEIFIIVCILLNTLVMSIEHPRLEDPLLTVVNISNEVFTFIFLLEMILKLIALGFLGYIRVAWNIFDGIVVIISIVDFIVNKFVPDAGGTGISVLRTFRLLRVLKLAKSWSTMNSLLATIGKSLGALGNLTVILAIIVYIFAVMGMQLLGNSYTPDKFGGSIPRWNFKDFPHSFMMIFRVLCGEWIEPLWDCMLATGPVAMLLFVPAFILGNFIILNLFLALLLSSFASESGTQPKKKKRKSFLSRMKNIMILMRLNKRTQVEPTKGEGEVIGENVSTGGEAEEEGVEQASSLELQPSGSTKKAVCCCVIDPTDYPVEPCFPTSWCVCRLACMDSGFCAVWKVMRYKVRRLVEHKVFEGIILFLIAASSISLAFEDVYLDSKPTLKQVLQILNILFAVIFTVEMLLKWIGLGFKTYFTNPWNILDFVIVIVSLATIFGNDQIAFIRSLRTLRAFRPLRAISRFEGMKVVITSLLHAIPGIGNVLLVCLMFWLIFSIMGVQIFGGKFGKCVDEGGEKYSASVVPNKTVCLSNGYRWENSNINFDTVDQGFLALLQVATFEGWMEIMEDAVDATKIDEQPIEENNVSAYLFFVVFIILGTFFTLNLFIGVIIDNFNQLKQQMEAVGSMDVFLTSTQRNWMNALKSAATKKPKKRIRRPQNKFQGELYDMVQSRKFEVFIMLFITINMVVMMVQHYDQSKEVYDTLEILNLIFTSVFILEAILRIIALRKGYFLNPWNVFDFVIVISSIIGIIVENLQTSLVINPSLLRVVRVFRVGRLLRFFEAARGIRRLLFSLVISTPALFNIGALLFLIIFIYAIIGMSIFGHVKKTEALNDVVNFETFGSSFVLLFRLMTSAGWNDILDPLMISEPDCDPNYRGLPSGNCGNKYMAPIYLGSFVVIIFLILINMYIAVILENYNQVMEQEKIGITNEDIELFYQMWELFDPNATQYIPYADLSDFVHQMEGNLRIPKPNKAACALLNIPLVKGDKIHCLDLLQALVKRIVSGFEDVDSEGFKIVMQRMEERFQAAFPSRTGHKSTITTMEIKRHQEAAKVIVRAIRGYRERKLLSALHTHLLTETGRVNKSFIGSLRELQERESRCQSEISILTNRTETNPQATDESPGDPTGKETVVVPIGTEASAPSPSVETPRPESRKQSVTLSDSRKQSVTLSDSRRQSVTTPNMRSSKVTSPQLTDNKKIAWQEDSPKKTAALETVEDGNEDLGTSESNTTVKGKETKKQNGR